MCQHNRFVTLLWEDDVIIRQCLDCSRIEIKVSDWEICARVKNKIDRFNLEQEKEKG